MFPDEVVCISQYPLFFFIGFQIILSTCLLHMEMLRKMLKKKKILCNVAEKVWLQKSQISNLMIVK